MAKGDVEMREIARPIENPIEQRNTGKGNPSAIAHYDRPLNNRQARLFEQLPEFDSRTTVRKKDASMRDLSALTALTGDEYAMFTRKGERMIVRGNAYMTNIDDESARGMAREGWRWSGHTHPGYDSFCLFSSDGDNAILEAFGQETGCIYNSAGEWSKFGKKGWL